MEIPRPRTRHQNYEMARAGIQKPRKVVSGNAACDGSALMTALREERRRRPKGLLAARATSRTRSSLRAPVSRTTTVASLIGSLVVAGVWAWPVDESPLVLDLGHTGPPDRPVADRDGVQFTFDGLLAGLTVAPNGAAIPVVEE